MSRKTLLAYIFCAGIFLTPLYTHAQEFFVTYEPTFRAEHAGLTLYDGNPIDPYTPPPGVTIRSSELTSVDGEWAIHELTAWSHDVPPARGAYVLERLDPETGGLEGGAAVRGQNYDVVHVGFTANATTTHTVSFDMPHLGAPETASGTYQIEAVEEPEFKYVYDAETDTTTELPFTDDDLGKFLARDADFVANTSADVRIVGGFWFLSFDYVADGEPPCTQDCFSNVLFLPGVKASRLYRPQVVGGEENKLWEPGGNDDIEDLFLNTDGTSVRDDVYTRDILDAHFSFGNGDVYKAFSDFMKDEVETGLINAWEPAPYDWRLALDDILESGAEAEDGISHLPGTDTPYIIQ